MLAHLLGGFLFSGLSCGNPEIIASGTAISNDLGVVVAITETGKPLLIINAHGENLIPQVGPPRHRSLFLSLERTQRYTLKTVDGAPGSGKIEQICDSAADALLRGRITLAYQNIDLTAPDLELLASKSQSTELTFYLRHLQAQNSLKRRENRIAAQQFEAISKWLVDLNDDQNSLAGVMSAAAADALGRQGDYLGMSNSAQRALTLLDTKQEGYFRARAQESLCSAKNNLGQNNAAIQCQRLVISLYNQTQEYDAELTAIFNLAMKLNKTGQKIIAFNSLTNGLFRIGAKAKPLTLGRVLLLRGMLHRNAGEFSQAIDDYEAARQFFEKSPQQQGRWMANLELEVAELYSLIGLRTHALNIARHALNGFDPKNEPARIAASVLRIAKMLEDVNLRQAIETAQVAKNLNSVLNLPMELDESNLVIAELNLSAAQKVEITSEARFSATKNAWKLIEAQNFLAQGKFFEAEKTLDAVSEEALDFSDKNIFTIVRAALNPEPEGAADILVSQMRKNFEIASRTTSSLLNKLLVRQNKSVCAAWVKYLKNSIDLNQAQLCFPAFAHPENAAVHGDFTPNDAVASLFGGIEGSLSDLPALRRVSKIAGAHAAISMRQFQTQLAPGTWALGIIPAQPQSFALWLSRDQIEMRLIIGERDLNQAVLALRKTLVSPDVAVSRINSVANILARAMFSNAPMQAAPTTLLVLDTDALSGIPWALLPWPSTGQPLIDTSVTSILTNMETSASLSPQSSQSGRHVVLVAPELDAKLGLPILPNALSEAKLVARTQSESWEMFANSEARPSTLVAALRAPNAWVHLVGHGRAKASLFGYTGILLAPEPPAREAEFTSWIDLIEKPLGADLVVLNVCQLAETSQDGGEASISFANALASAGVDHVIAAMWPISDGAAAKWVPVFYQKLGGTLTQTGNAFRAAQLSMYHSRAYRHPYYWAGLTYVRSFAALQLSH